MTGGAAAARRLIETFHGGVLIDADAQKPGTAGDE